MILVNFQVLNKNKIAIVIIIFTLLISGLIFSNIFLKNRETSDYKNPESKKSHLNRVGDGVKEKDRPSFISDNINLDSIFKHRQPVVENNFDKTSSRYTLLATGDIVIGRSVNYKTVTSKNFKLPYEKTADFLKSSDITFINFESPLVEDCPITVEGMIFCGDNRNIEGLTYSDIDIVNLANNHMGNYGKEGIDNTVRILEENGIAYTGIEESAVLEVKGKKFGFLGYNEVADAGPYVSGTDPEVIQREIRQLRDRVDFVIVAFHWGVEYTSNPSENQINLAHLAVDSGADLIIGNHPHWVQGVEIYKDRFISYSHGNFIFDQMWSRETGEGVIGKYVFDDDGLVEVEYFPVIIDDYNQPRFASEEEAEVVLSRMRESSLNLMK
jgi:poly-gamma-glutamate synthesis protein (capsule biosynthesis protein)